MTTERHFIFAKTKKQKRIQELLEHGRLRMCRLDTYRKMEGDVIGDRNEGVGMHYSGRNPGLEVSITLPNGEVFPLTGRIERLVVEAPERYHAVFCVTAFETEGKGTLPFNGVVEEFVRDPRNRGFGDTMAIFKNSPEFARRLEAAAKKAGYGLHSDLVTYLPSDYCGDVTPFQKIGDYGYQKEWRFVTNEPIPGEYLDLELGSLLDIALWTDLTKLDVTAA